MQWDWSRIDNPGFTPDEGNTNANPGQQNANNDGEVDVEILNDQPMMDVDRNLARPDTAAAVGRPDTAAAVGRPDTANTTQGHGSGRRATAPSTFFEQNGQQPRTQTYTGSNTDAYARSGSNRPATASRITQGNSATATGGPTAGTRPSTAYGLRTAGSDRKASSSKQDNVVAGARGMLRYRRTRAATDSQVDGGGTGHAWNSNQLPTGGAGRERGGAKGQILPRKGDGTTPAWDGGGGAQGGRRSQRGGAKGEDKYGSGFKYDGRLNGGTKSRPSSGGGGRR